MCYSIIPTKRFQEDIEYYIRKKKFTNIDDDLEPIISSLEKGELLGEVINGLKIKSQNHTYKVRVANSNTKAGKSNGYRLLYYVVKDDREIYLLTIYYKKDDIDIPNNLQIAAIINEYCL
jgi:mRNA-degrading endonuclease RelE of RelBE toxin-antitoxin system